MSQDVMNMIKEKEVQFVDLRFTDLRGKMQHVSFDLSLIDPGVFTEGLMFDGSSIAGWKVINESDMVMRPDPMGAHIDPFFQQTTLALFCDILEPGTLQPYNRCPRGIAKRAEAYLKSTGVGDVAYFGPEAEFFIFDDVRWTTEPNNTGYMFDSTELPFNTGRAYENGNMGHRPVSKGGYFPVPPVDAFQDMRSEMLAVMGEIGLEPEKHHHEVAPAQHELGLKFKTLTRMADCMNLYKYVIHNVAASYGKTATFMPKPYFKDNGSGMHVHQSIWKNERNQFAGDRYADLSETCLHYIGGVIRHARAINAFTNSTTNSYKRLVPGYEAPVLLAYSARNRSAACRIPHGTGTKTKRVEVRFPDPAGNMYLSFAAMMMAGLDGVANKINPGDPLDKNLYDLPPEELKDVPTVCGTLREALGALDADREFLKKGQVMDDDMIDAYIDLKREELDRFETHPHPVEFDMYYKC